MFVDGRNIRHYGSRSRNGSTTHRRRIHRRGRRILIWSERRRQLGAANLPERAPKRHLLNPIGNCRHERGKQAGELAKKASRVKSIHSAAQARDETARGALGSIARKVEFSFTNTTTASKADESLTTCPSVLDPVHAKYNPSGVGLRTKPDLFNCVLSA
jgi:hypothetical protein